MNHISKNMNTNKGLYELENKINARLASLPADQRPETSHRSKIQSVAYLGNGGFETTDGDGMTESITIDQAKAILDL